MLSLFTSLAVGAESMETCNVAIVGGGPGGVYTAMRLANSTANLSVCVFERRERLGGRVLTINNMGPHKDLNVDVGAYRFARHLSADKQDTTCV